MAAVNRPLRYGTIALLVLALIGVCALAGWVAFGPGYIESSIVPDIGRRMGLKDLSLDIRRIGLGGADIRSLRIGKADAPALILGPVLIDYAPSGLLAGRIDRISVGGAEIYCGYENGTFYLRGLDVRSVLSKFESGEDETTSDAGKAPVFPVGAVRIDNGVMVVFYENHQYRLPFEGIVEKDGTSPHIVHGTLTFYPRGESVILSGRVDLENQTARAEIDGKAIETDRFADWTRRLPGLTLSGRLDIAGNGDFQLNPPSVASASADATFHSRDAGYAGISLIPFEAADTPLSLSLDWQERPRIRIAMPTIRGDQPLPFEISDARADLRWGPEGMGGEGRCVVSLRKTPEGAGAPVTVVSPLSIPLTFQVRENAGTQGWRIAATSEKEETPSNRAEFSAAGTAIALKMDRIEVAGTLGENTASADFLISTGELTLSSGDVQATFPGLTAKGTASREQNGQTGAEGSLSLAHGSLRALDDKLQLQRAGASLPFRWPLKAEKGQKGEVAIGSIVWDGLNLGALEGSLRQVPRGFTLSAEHWNLILSGMGVWINGDFPLFSEERSESRIDVSASWPKSSPDLDLGRFSPLAKGFKVNGDLSAEGRFSFGGAGTSGGVLTAHLKEGFLKKGEQEIAVTGIDAGVRLPYLPDVRSATAQKLTIQKAAFGQVAITDAVIAFQLEPGGALLIEKGRWQWAGGKVSSHAMRITPGSDVYELVLYCDRLSLAKVLEQFGAVKADGDGTVNGRIPIRMAKGDLSFDDGFLYSTPGDGGAIHVAGAELLTAGIPEGTMQFNQVDLAREALREYHYDWAKLQLNTEGDDLIMALHLDGKPMNTLPFVYKKEVGGFVRISEDQVGSRFQGIRLDVNFRLPLNRILHYRDLFGLIGASF